MPVILPPLLTRIYGRLLSVHLVGSAAVHTDCTKLMETSFTDGDWSCGVMCPSGDHHEGVQEG